MAKAKSVAYIRSLTEQDEASKRAAVKKFAANEGIPLGTIYTDILLRDFRDQESFTRAGIYDLLEKARKRTVNVIVYAWEDLEHPDITIKERPAWESLQVRVVGEPPKPVSETLPTTPPPPARNQVALRLYKGRVAGAKKGKFVGGVIPYGYRKNPATKSLELDPFESVIAKMIFTKYLELQCADKVRQFLLTEGFTTRRKKQWSKPGIYWILKNSFYRGVTHYAKTRRKSISPRIITPYIFKKVQKLLKMNNRWERSGKQKRQRFKK